MTSTPTYADLINVFNFLGDHSGGAVWTINCLHPLKHCDRGFESHLRHGCLCAFILCLCCSVCRLRPCVGLIPRPRSPTDCVRIKKLNKLAVVHKGCRAIDRVIFLNKLPKRCIWLPLCKLLTSAPLYTDLIDLSILLNKLPQKRATPCLFPWRDLHKSV
jgi:hypothetical protein